MDLVRNRYSLLLTIEVLTLFVYGFCILLNVICGSKFTERDTIFAAVVFGICFVILALTIALACRARTNSHNIHLVQITKSYQRLPLTNIRLYASDCAICLSPKDPTLSSLVKLNGCQHDYHKDCIKECFEKTWDLRCPKCRQVPTNLSSLTSKKPVSLTSKEGDSMTSDVSRCSSPVTVTVDPD